MHAPLESRHDCLRTVSYCQIVSDSSKRVGQAETPPVKKGVGKKGTHSATWMILSRNVEEAIVATTRLGPMTVTGISQEPLIPALGSSRSLCGADSTHLLCNSRSPDQAPRLATRQ